MSVVERSREEVGGVTSQLTSSLPLKHFKAIAVRLAPGPHNRFILIAKSNLGEARHVPPRTLALIIAMPFARCDRDA